MNLFNDRFAESISELSNKVAKEQEKAILSQLNEFIKRGLIVIQTTGPILVQDQFSDEIQVKTSVVLKLKDQEYIEELEEENKRLKEAIDRIKSVI